MIKSKGNNTIESSRRFKKRRETMEGTSNRTQDQKKRRRNKSSRCKTSIHSLEDSLLRYHLNKKTPRGLKDLKIRIGSRIIRNIERSSQLLEEKEEQPREQK